MQVEKTCRDCDDVAKENSVPNKKRLPSEHLNGVNDIIREEGFIKHQVNKRIIAKKGDSYLADLYEIDIKGVTFDGEKEINVFVKSIIPDENTLMSVTKAYFKESFTYKELSKMFNEIQNNANIPEKKRLNMAKSYNATNTEAIYLENLTKQGFITYDRMGVMSLRFGELAVKQLAKFHGLFYVLQKKRPEYFDEYLKIWKHPFIDGQWQEFIINQTDITTKQLTKETKEKLQKYKLNMLKKFLSYADSPACTICHGDYRVNNILVKEVNGSIAKLVPVDFQLLYYGCPITDLVYLIFNASDREFRKKHLKYLKDLYYDHLEKFLAYFNLDIKDIFPRKEFERQYVKKLDFGLIFALYCIPFLFTEEDHQPDMGQADATKLQFVLDSRYSERIQGIVDDFIEWGYL